MTISHPTTAETVPALLATIQELHALQQPLIDALQRIHGDMENARSGGDEWASEWTVQVWNELPLAVRAAGGDQDAAQELADAARTAVARQTTGQDPTAPDPTVVEEFIRDMATQNPACACTHPQDRHLSACTECPCVGYAPTWPPTKRRIVPVCDQCRAPWDTGHTCATAPAVGQPAEAQDADEAHPADVTFTVEKRGDADWLTASSHYDEADRDKALSRLARRRAQYPDTEFRLVRETTTWTVEETR